LLMAVRSLHAAVDSINATESEASCGLFLHTVSDFTSRRLPIRESKSANPPYAKFEHFFHL